MQVAKQCPLKKLVGYYPYRGIPMNCCDTRLHRSIVYVRRRVIPVIPVIPAIPAIPVIPAIPAIPAIPVTSVTRVYLDFRGTPKYLRMILEPLATSINMMCAKRNR